MEPTCPKCHSVVDPTDFFCSTCGKKLKAKPLSTSLLTEILYYFGSVLLPPLGIWWGIKYLFQPGAASKRIGIISIVLTIVSFTLTSVLAVDFVNTMYATYKTQLNTVQELY